jgi:hypothetical protein
MDKAAIYFNFLLQRNYSFLLIGTPRKSDKQKRDGTDCSSARWMTATFPSAKLRARTIRGAKFNLHTIIRFNVAA